MKVLILYNQLFHYRIPVWNELATKCDLTVAYSIGDGMVPEGMPVKFKILHLPVKTIAKRFVIQTGNIRKLTKEYDVIIAYGDIAWLKYSTLPWFNKSKVVYHTLGVSASYNKGFDEKKGWDRIRAFFYRQASALAFYTDYPIAKYEKFGIPKERMFVAPNTVSVHPVKETVVKDSLLVIGTLYRQKGLQLLLDVYAALKDKIKLPQLFIIGKGPDYEEIKKWIEDNNMTGLIHLEGPIYDIDKKAKYFARALACVSPKQAGLTVLESMGYGVPFITSAGAITGGEIFNIHNNVDGIVMENESELLKVVEDIALNTEKYILMGQKAKEFYDNNRTVKHMANGLWDAVQYAASN